MTHELNGYPKQATLPPYRSSLHGQLKADLSEPFGSGAKNVPVPLTQFPNEIRGEVTEFTFYQGVATLESLVSDAGRSADARIMSPFPVEIFARMEIWQGYQTMSMWVEGSHCLCHRCARPSAYPGALTFTLEIEAGSPNAGKALTGDQPPVPIARADQIFNTTIYEFIDSVYTLGFGSPPRPGRSRWLGSGAPDDQPRKDHASAGHNSALAKSRPYLDQAPGTRLTHPCTGPRWRVRVVVQKASLSHRYHGVYQARRAHAAVHRYQSAGTANERPSAQHAEPPNANSDPLCRQCRSVHTA